MCHCHLKRVNDRLFEVLREIPVHNMIIPKRHPSRIDKELLGLWVNHLGGDHVVREGDKLLICRTVEDAVIV